MSPARGASEPAGPSFAATVAALAIGQLLCWAALYYSFSSFVLPMMRELGYGRDYEYDHDTEEGFSGQDYFPEGMDRLRLFGIGAGNSGVVGGADWDGRD